MALIFAQKLTRTYRQRGFLFWSLLYPLQSRFSLQGVATTATAAALCYCHHHYQSGPRSLPSHHLETSWCPGGSRVRTCALGTLTPADLSACVCASAWGISSARAWAPLSYQPAQDTHKFKDQIGKNFKTAPAVDQ